MTTAEMLVEQAAADPEQTVIDGSERQCFVWLRGEATYQARRTAQTVKVIAGCAWITFDGEDRVVCSGQAITLEPGNDDAVISRLKEPVLVFSID
ncbi:MAG: hypothetical protein IT324_21000 [Anaerolineae bacterium]|nr:hypothetical protein [Anaerolineae bacterium]